MFLSNIAVISVVRWKVQRGVLPDTATQRTANHNDDSALVHILVMGIHTDTITVLILVL